MAIDTSNIKELDLDELNDLLDDADNEREDAATAMGEDPSEENITKLTVLARQCREIKEAIAAKEHAETGDGANAIVQLTAAGKNSTTIQVPAGTTIKAAVEQAGWSVAGVTFAITAEGQARNVDGSTQVQAGQSLAILVQPQVRGGKK